MSEIPDDDEVTLLDAEPQEREREQEEDAEASDLARRKTLAGHNWEVSDLVPWHITPSTPVFLPSQRRISEARRRRTPSSQSQSQALQGSVSAS